MGRAGPDFLGRGGRGEVVSTVFVRRIRKIPKPQRFEDSLGNVTNVYTKPAYRYGGIGNAPRKRVREWAGREDLEVLIVWPRPGSERFHRRARFDPDTPVMEIKIREGDGTDEL